ncbi:MAG TPA: flagellar biosynthetic protein FliO [Tepidisphaeraceae bacterium]|nr:flagellar biosynthetic protein FliO [Tepidisphaeraceae bacterium]
MPTTLPAVAAAQPSASVWESTELGRSPKDTTRRPATASSGSSSFSVWRLAGSLAFVLLVIFAVRWVGRRFLGLSPVRDSSGVIQVLCRSTLSPKQRLLLVQVGRRMVLVADCGSQMNALCEITDPEEIAALTGQIEQRKADSSTNAFLSMVGRASAQFEETEKPSPEPDESTPTAPGVDPQVSGMQKELSGLLEKVRVLSRHFRQD